MRISEDDPNYDKFIEATDLPYEEIGENSNFQVHRLNGSGGIAVYRSFNYEGELPGTNMSSSEVYGVEIEHLSDESFHYMFLKPEGGRTVFEYQGGERVPEEVHDFDTLGPVTDIRIKEMLEP